jgi:hypothetical protein
MLVPVQLLREQASLTRVELRVSQANTSWQEKLESTADHNNEEEL